MSFRLARIALITLTACVVSVPSLAAPERLVIVRHGEKLDTWQLCQTGLDRAQALNDHYLGPKAADPIFASAPAAILTITLHTSETAQPTAHALGLPLTNFVALPAAGISKLQMEVLTNHQNQRAAQVLLTDPQYAGKQVLMFWEHFRIASAALEARYPGEQVTLRQLLKLDQPPFANQVPATWPDGNYNFFWIVDFNPDGSIKAFNTIRQAYQGRYANLPNNDWGTPEPLAADSPCRRN